MSDGDDKTVGDVYNGAGLTSLPAYLPVGSRQTTGYVFGISIHFLRLSMQVPTPQEKPHQQITSVADSTGHWAHNSANSSARSARSSGRCAEQDAVAAIDAPLAELDDRPTCSPSQRRA